MVLNSSTILRFAIRRLFFTCVMIGHTVCSFAMVTPNKTSKWCYYYAHPKQSKIDDSAKILDIPISFLETENLIKILHGLESNWRNIGLFIGWPRLRLNEIRYLFSQNKESMTYLIQLMQEDQVTCKQLAFAIYMPGGGDSPLKAQHLMDAQARVAPRYAAAVLTRLNRDFLSHLPKTSHHFTRQLNNMLNPEVDLTSIYYPLYEQRVQAINILMKLNSNFYATHPQYYNPPHKNHLLLLKGLGHTLARSVYSWSDIIQAVFAFNGGNDAPLAEEHFQRYNSRCNYTFAQFKSEKYLASLPDDQTSASYSSLTPLYSLCSYLTSFFWRYDHPQKNQ